MVTPHTTLSCTAIPGSSQGLSVIVTVDTQSNPANSLFSYVDAIPPSCVLSGRKSTTSSDVEVAVNCSEAVYGMSTAAFEYTGCSMKWVSGEDRQYKLFLSRKNKAPNCTVALKAGAITDIANNTNYASNLFTVKFGRQSALTLSYVLGKKSNNLAIILACAIGGSALLSGGAIFAACIVRKKKKREVPPLNVPMESGLSDPSFVPVAETDYSDPIPMDEYSTTVSIPEASLVVGAPSQDSQASENSVINGE